MKINSLKIFSDKEKTMTNILVFPKEAGIIGIKENYFAIIEKQSSIIYVAVPLIEFPNLASKQDPFIVPPLALYSISPLWFAKLNRKLLLTAGIIKESVYFGDLLKKDLEKIKNKNFTEKTAGFLEPESQVYKQFEANLDEKIAYYTQITQKFNQTKKVFYAANCETLEKDEFLLSITPSNIKIISKDKSVKTIKVYFDNILLDVVPMQHSKAQIDIEGLFGANTILEKINIKRANYEDE
ncbi:MAG: hypothetical protein ACP5SC_06330 [Desulfurella sp.]